VETVDMGLGRPDASVGSSVLIVYRSSEVGEPTTSAERRWRWDPQTDTWSALAAEGKWTAYEGGEGGDW
jgi:hypothetical protein